VAAYDVCSLRQVQLACVIAPLFLSACAPAYTHTYTHTHTGGAPGLLSTGFKAPIPPTEDTVSGPYWKRQYVFAAATMPSITFSDVGSRIHKLYPEAEWIATDALHTSKRQVTHAWQKVGGLLLLLLCLAGGGCLLLCPAALCIPLVRYCVGDACCFFQCSSSSSSLIFYLDFLTLVDSHKCVACRTNVGRIKLRRAGVWYRHS